MAQLRQDHGKFVAEDAVVMVVGPEGKDSFRKYWEKESLPFVGLPDPKRSVLKLFGQEIKLFKFGRMPAQVTIDKDGIVRFVHYGDSMSDIPQNETVLELLHQMNQ